MSDFSAHWLDLRAPFDSRARSTDLEGRLDRFLRQRSDVGEVLYVVDLGAGSGNNHRHLSPRLGLRQHWTLIDGDAALLAHAAGTSDVGIREADLTGDLDALIPARTGLVTASALIDLVSREWLGRLLERIRAIDAALLLVLTYDGRIRWEDGTATDDWIRGLVNGHQRSDKGFGPALGPDAVRTLQDLAGPRLATVSSDWRIGAEQTAMRRALVDGWADAAEEIAPAQAEQIRTWAANRRERASSLMVGHADQLLLPG